MNIKKRKNLLESKKDKRILVEKLNKLCIFLDKEYKINSGGCCYLAYCLADLLSHDGVKYDIIIYEDYEISESFKELSESHYHYALKVDKYIINSMGLEKDKGICRNIYNKVTTKDILNHYNASEWNRSYDSSKNVFIQRIIKSFYSDFTDDLRKRRATSWNKR